jgi:hypothetical protein
MTTTLAGKTRGGTHDGLPVRAGWPSTLGMLASRTVLFAVFQASIALSFFLSGTASPWEESIAWWPVTATLTNFVVVAAMATLFRREGGNYLALFRIDRKTVRSDLAVLAASFVVISVLAIGPNVALSTLLWGNPERSLDLLVRPLPLWAAWVALVLFPLTIPFAELPTYFGYARPRLRALTGKPWVAILVSGAFLSLQHATLPLIFDWRFIVWRAFMFLLFALFTAWLLTWRPRLLPYTVVVHGLLDLMMGWQVLSASLG